MCNRNAERRQGKVIFFCQCGQTMAAVLKPPTSAWHQRCSARWWRIVRRAAANAVASLPGSASARCSTSAAALRRSSCGNEVRAAASVAVGAV